MTNSFRGAVAALAALGALSGGSAPAAAESPVVALTQTACQFLEPEKGYDHGFETRQATDCVRINAETGASRLAHAMPLSLKPGHYVFRVTNRDVPYQLGFFLRAENPLQRTLKPKVVGGGLGPGETRDYAVDLVPGRYVYSCPLNPTPDYPLVVEE